MPNTGIFTQSREIQAQASEMGFDWPNPRGVLDKLVEEVGEVREALEANDLEHAQRELGDLLLAAVNLSRFLHILPEDALAGATERFETRFSHVVEAAKEAKIDMRGASLDQLDILWEKAKDRTG